MGIVAIGETLSLIGEYVGETHRALNTNPPTRKSAPKGHKSLVGSEGSEGEWDENRASGIVPSLTPPPHTAPQSSNEGCPALANT